MQVACFFAISISPAVVVEIWLGLNFGECRIAGVGFPGCRDARINDGDRIEGMHDLQWLNSEDAKIT